MRRKTNRTHRRPLGVLTLILVLVALVILLGAGTAFAANHWTDITDQQWIATYHVTAAQAATVAAGYPDGTFKPGLAVTRGQFAKMVVDGFGLGTANPLTPTFTDVPRTNFFFPWVQGAYSAGVISGYPDGTFRPNTSVSRQQADSILGLYLSQKELSLNDHIQGALTTYPTVSAWYAAEGAELLDSFADAASVASVHAPYAAYLAYHQVVQGSSRAGGVYLDPVSSLTRAQAVALILRVEGVTFAPGIPTVTLLSPASGPTAGGNSVVITGTNFVGVTAVKFGTVNATSYVVSSPTQITAVAPAGTAGTTVDVGVTNAAGTSAISAADKYTYGLPTVTAVSPPGGTTLGGTYVTITGTNFITGATVAFGTGYPATSVLVLSSTMITCYSPAHLTGVVDVTVTTSAGTSVVSAADKYSYGLPTVTAVSPPGGTTLGGTYVTITGTNFVTGATVAFGTGYPATSVSVLSSTMITCYSPAHLTGVVDVTVTTSAGTSIVSAADQYSYGLPTVTLLTPAAGTATGGTSVVITGTGFTGVTAVMFGANNATSYVVNSAAQITAVAPAGVAGTTVDVTVTTSAGTSAVSAADKYSYGLPTVTLLTPAAGTAAGGTSVVITGTGFTGVTAVMFGANNATSYVVNSAAQITAVAPAGVAGTTVDVTVTTPAGTTAASAASKYSYGVPTVSSVTPNSGPAGGTNTVTIAGTGFTGLGGAAAVMFGANNATSYVVNSPTSISAVVPAGVAGMVVDVIVTNPAGPSAAVAGDHYTYGTPTVTLLTPAAGPTGGANLVLIAGTGFTGATAVKFGVSSATSYVVNSSTSITATAPAGTGTVDVTVTTPAGISATSAASKYSYGVPTVTLLAPTNGPAAGGTSVVITGTGFTGVSAVAFGANPATSFTVNSPTSITAVAPAGINGTNVSVTVTNPVGPSSGGANTYYYGVPTLTLLTPAAGAAGGTNTVTITGTNFVTGATVLFGANAGTSVNVVNSTTITVVAPAGTAGTTVDVTVTTPAGISATSAASKYSYGVPTVTLLAPTNGPAAGGNLGCHHRHRLHGSERSRIWRKPGD